jgi:hypothetical protein
MKTIIKLAIAAMIVIAPAAPSFAWPSWFEGARTSNVEQQKEIQRIQRELERIQKNKQMRDELETKRMKLIVDLGFGTFFGAFFCYGGTTLFNFGKLSFLPKAGRGAMMLGGALVCGYGAYHVISPIKSYYDYSKSIQRPL